MSDTKELSDLLDKAASAGELSAEDRTLAEKALSGEGQVPDELLRDEPEAPAQPASAPPPAALLKENADDNLDIRTALGKMSIPQKIKLALFGNSICRTLLIRDPNKMIQQFVLKNPKLGLAEVEEFSRNPNLSDAVLRTIAANQTWTKSYAVKANLVFNSKTPLDISLKWVRFLNATDLKKVSKSKNVSQVISTVAKKKLAEEK